MRENIRVSLLTFVTVLIPVTIWNAISLYLASSCDPKFGCLGVFKLLTLIVVICAVISTLSISAAHYMFVFRHHRTIGSCEYLALTVLGVAISAITINAMDMAEELGILALSTAWGIASFSFGGLIYGLCKKYNK